VVSRGSWKQALEEVDETATDVRAGRTWDQFGAASGVLFVVLVLPGIVLSAPSGDPTKPAAEIEQTADGYAQVKVGIYLMLVAVFFFLTFLAYLNHYLRAAEGPEGWMASVVHGGGLVAAAVLLVLGAIRLAATVVSDYEGDPQVAKTFVLLDWDYAGVLGPAFAAVVGGTSVIALRFGLLPRALAWTGAVLAGLLAFSGFYGGSLVAVGVLWILVLAIALLVRAFSGVPA